MIRWADENISMLALEIAAGIVLGGLVLFALPWLLDQTVRGLPGVAVLLFGSVLVALLVADPNSVAEPMLVIGGAGAVIGLVAWWSHKAGMKRRALSGSDRGVGDGEKRG
jgi:hypothetical protein